MPTIRFEGEEIECDRGDVLRDALLDAGQSPHNGTADYLNCLGNAHFDCTRATGRVPQTVEIVCRPVVR